MLQSWRELDLQSTVQLMQANSRNSTFYTRLDSLTCLLTYNTMLENRSDFIMVSSEAPKSNNSLLVYGMTTSGTWDIGYHLCAAPNAVDCGRLANLPLAQQVQAVQDWNIGGYKIDYCLSSQRSLEGLCSVDYSFAIMLSRSPSLT